MGRDNSDITVEQQCHNWLVGTHQHSVPSCSYVNEQTTACLSNITKQSASEVPASGTYTMAQM